MEDDIKVTVVTVVYNGAAHLEQTIQSVINQSYTNIEYIVIDGGSTDKSPQIIKQYKDHISFWVSEPDNGIYDAMNKGIAHATGKWINFMNCGDSFFSLDVIQKFVEIASRSSTPYSIFYGDAIIVDGNKSKKQCQFQRHLDKKCSIIHQSMFFNASDLKKNIYDLQFKIMADYNYLLKVSSKNLSLISYLDFTICIYDKTGISSKPLYTYFREYIKITKRYMSKSEFLNFIIYIIPRYIYSFFR